jgi:hypothetical protein
MSKEREREIEAFLCFYFDGEQANVPNLWETQERESKQLIQ